MVINALKVKRASHHWFNGHLVNVSVTFLMKLSERSVTLLVKMVDALGKKMQWLKCFPGCKAQSGHSSITDVKLLWM